MVIVVIWFTLSEVPLDSLYRNIDCTEYSVGYTRAAIENQHANGKDRVDSFNVSFPVRRRVID